MHTFLRVVALVLVLLLSGCAEPTIDGSSEDAFYRSAGRMAQALPTEERDAFTDALMMVVMADVDFTAAPGETDRLDLAAAMARLDGMTIDQVMAKGETLRLRHGAAVRRGVSRQAVSLNSPE